MLITENTLKNIIEEELSRSDVNSILNDKINSADFKKKIKQISAEVVNELFKILWQRNSIWKSSVSS
jgi:diphthamide synthase (EF-2-diphthine--ammonia ligase)